MVFQAVSPNRAFRQAFLLAIYKGRGTSQRWNGKCWRGGSRESLGAIQSRSGSSCALENVIEIHLKCYTDSDQSDNLNYNGLFIKGETLSAITEPKARGRMPLSITIHGSINNYVF